MQQGTVNSSILFNIFTSDLTKLFELNTGDTSAIAFADDVIIYTTGNRVELVRSKLETLVNKINTHYTNWNLRLNPSKCETILFSKPLYYLSSKAKAGSSNFQMCTNIPGTMDKVTIPHKKNS